MCTRTQVHEQFTIYFSNTDLLAYVMMGVAALVQGCLVYFFNYLFAVVSLLLTEREVWTPALEGF